MSMQQVQRARAKAAAETAKLNAAALANPPHGPKIFVFPLSVTNNGTNLSAVYSWSPEMHQAALAGVTMYMFNGGTLGPRWVQPMGSGIVAQYPQQAKSGGASWVQGVIADKLKSANTGVLGGTVDKIAPWIGAALLAYVSAGTLSQYAAASAAADSTAVATTTESASIMSPTGETASLSMGATAPTTMTDSIINAGLGGQDLVTTAVANAGADVSTLATAVDAGTVATGAGATAATVTAGAVDTTAATSATGILGSGLSTGNALADAAVAKAVASEGQKILGKVNQPATPVATEQPVPQQSGSKFALGMSLLLGLIVFL